MILCAQDIRRRGIITPFNERKVAHGMTFGLGPAGYDVRIRQSVIMWPGRFYLASTMESFHMPDDLMGKVADKSTWARRGICVQNTIIEPGWIANSLTLEITNHSWRPVFIKAGMPIAQIIFEQLTQPTEIPYRGKYQYQGHDPVPAIHERYNDPRDRHRG